MKDNRYYLIACCLATLFITTSCLGIKRNATSVSSSKYYESFYLEDGVTQYFAKPLPLENATSKKHHFTLTVRKKTDGSSTAQVNIFFFTKVSFGNNEVISLSFDDTTYQANLLYSEKNEELYSSRIVCDVNYQDFLIAVAKEEFAFSVSTNTTASIQLKTTKKTYAILEKLRTVFLY